MFLKFFSFSITSLFLVSCSSIGKFQTPASEKLKFSPVKSAKIQFSMQENEVQTYQIRSSSNKKTYENNQIVNAKMEEVDFKVENRALAVNPEKGIYSFRVKTLEKDGFVNLRDLAFPEVGEKIDYQMNSLARVLSAGRFPQDSVYYIPSVVLPKDEVSVGDTWDFTAEYVLIESGIPLRLELTSILKRFVDCGLKLCADIEISGAVKIVNKIDGVNYASEMAGRMLVTVDGATILWQRIRSGEKMETRGGNIVIYSCIESKKVRPAAFSPLRGKDLDCKALGKDSLFVEPLNI